MNQLRDRNWYYKTLQVAKRQLGMNNESYRSVLFGCGAKMDDSGKFSATTMSVVQLENALEHMRQCGFKFKRKKTPANFKDGQLAKIKGMWTKLHEAGVMHQPYSDKTISIFSKKITHQNHIKWASPTGLAKVIESLKSIAAREQVHLNEAE